MSQLDNKRKNLETQAENIFPRPSYPEKSLPIYDSIPTKSSVNTTTLWFRENRSPWPRIPGESGSDWTCWTRPSYHWPKCRPMRAIVAVFPSFSHCRVQSSLCSFFEPCPVCSILVSVPYCSDARRQIAWNSVARRSKRPRRPRLTNRIDSRSSGSRIAPGGTVLVPMQPWERFAALRLWNSVVNSGKIWILNHSDTYRKILSRFRWTPPIIRSSGQCMKFWAKPEQPPTKSGLRLRRWGSVESTDWKYSGMNFLSSRWLDLSIDRTYWCEKLTAKP